MYSIQVPVYIAYSIFLRTVCTHALLKVKDLDKIPMEWKFSYLQGIELRRRKKIQQLIIGIKQLAFYD